MNRSLPAYLALVLVGASVLWGAFDPYQEAKTADKGPYPWEYKGIVGQFIQDTFYDPGSIIDFELTKPSAGWWRSPGFSRAKTRTVFCWAVLFTVNAKNRMGGYIGKRIYSVSLRDGQIIGTVEIAWNKEGQGVFQRFKSQGETEFRAKWEGLSPEERERVGKLLGSENQAQVHTDSPTPAYIEELRALGELRDKGIITEEEFQTKKRQLLGLSAQEPPQPPKN